LKKPKKSPTPPPIKLGQRTGLAVCDLGNQANVVAGIQTI
jgi:hypothetical protein